MEANGNICPACGRPLSEGVELSLVKCRGCGAELFRDRSVAAAAWLPLPPRAVEDPAFSALAAQEEEEADNLAALIDAERQQRIQSSDEVRRNESTKRILLAGAVVLAVCAVMLLTVSNDLAFTLPAMGALLVLTTLTVLLMLQVHASSRASARRLLALRRAIGDASRRAAAARSELNLYLREHLTDSAGEVDS